MSESKIILTGNFGVGKSSIFRRLLNDAFEEKYLTTIGVKLGRKIIDDSNFLFWDIAGEVAQDKIPPTYFLNNSLILYVIDLSRQNSFHNIGSDLDFLQKNYADSGIITIGNKIDLFHSEESLSNRISQLPIKCDLFSSAKTGDGFDEMRKCISGFCS